MQNQEIIIYQEERKKYGCFFGEQRNKEKQYVQREVNYFTCFKIIAKGHK